MTEHEAQLVQMIASAVMEAVYTSGEVDEALDHVKMHGYDVMMNIQFNFAIRPSEDSRHEPQDSGPPIKFTWNSRDDQFLRMLKIEPPGTDHDNE